MTIISASGMAPPRRKMPRQPSTGSQLAAMRPPSMAPAGRPSSTPVIIMPRLEPVLYSPASASSEGVAPPMPRPIRKRSTMICVGEVA